MVLTVTVTVSSPTRPLFLAGAQQAGVFGVAGFDNQNRDAVLATYCLNAFPYARTAVSNLIQDGGFPPFLMQPINLKRFTPTRCAAKPKAPR